MLHCLVSPHAALGALLVAFGKGGVHPLLLGCSHNFRGQGLRQLQRFTALRVTIHIVRPKAVDGQTVGASCIFFALCSRQVCESWIKTLIKSTAELGQPDLIEDGKIPVIVTGFIPTSRLVATMHYFLVRAYVTASGALFIWSPSSVVGET